MLRDKLQQYDIILASGSPRREELLRGLDVDFRREVRAVEESFPQVLTGSAITDYLAQLKAKAFGTLLGNQLIITADTIVWMNGRAMNKPADADEALEMLMELSGRKHEVITSVCFTTRDTQKTVNDLTEVWFRELSRDELAYYIRTRQPYDKAGSYGIQEWLGFVGIEKIKGCYFNVMGLPTRLVYKTLMEFGERGH